MTLMLSSRRKDGGALDKGSDIEVSLEFALEKERLAKLSIEGLEELERHLLECQRLEALGRLYTSDDDEK